MLISRNTRTLLIIFTTIATLGISGCAGNQLAVKPDEMASLKGQSTTDIIKKLGEPTRKSIDSSDVQTWEYKAPAASQSAMNTFAAIGTFGIGTGSNSAYVDVLRLTFKKGVVTKYSFEENVMNINVPGLSAQSSSPVETSPQQIEAPEKSTALNARENVVPINETSEKATLASSTTNASSMIVTGNKAKIRKKPSTKAEIVKSLKKGEIVQVIKHNDEWFQVELASGDVGWCHTSVLAQK